MNDATLLTVLQTIRDTAADRPRTGVAAMQGLSREPFVVLVATVLSSRTKDETTVPAAKRLLERAPSAAALADVPEDEIAALIRPVGFFKTKARLLRRLAGQLLAEYDGCIPADLDALVRLPGVGRKTANLVLARAFDIPAICVDTHVQRIMNRLGYLQTHEPYQTEQALRQRLPVAWWPAVNELLVAYGQSVCHPTSPHCSRCVVADRCKKVGVGRRR